MLGEGKGLPAFFILMIKVPVICMAARVVYHSIQLTGIQAQSKVITKLITLGFVQLCTGEFP